MTEAIKKMYAQFKDNNDLDANFKEVTTLQDAINYGMQHGLRSFQMINVMIPAGHHLELVPVPEGEWRPAEHQLVSDANSRFHSSFRVKEWGDKYYVGIEKVLTGADIAARYETKIKELEAKEQDEKTLALLNKYDDAREIWLQRSNKLVGQINTERKELLEFDYPNIEASAKAYNKQGQQIWPKSAALVIGAKPSTPRI